MRRFPAFFTALTAFLLAAGLARAADGWTQLKPGMTSDQAIKFLGEPLMRTKARGFERWIYDGNGEVIFMGGPLKSWTVATPSPESEARPIEFDVLMRSVRGGRTPSVWTPRTPAPASTYERELSGSGGSH